MVKTNSKCCSDTFPLFNLYNLQNRFEVLSPVSEGDANAFGAQKPVSSQESGHTPSQIQ